MAYLLEKKPEAGAEARKFDLPEGEPAVVGRSASKCNVPVPGAAVSGIHATISRGPDAFVLKDLGSTNGTTLVGAPVEADKDVKVYRGDEIQFGDFAVTLEGDDVPSRPADAPRPAPPPAPEPEPEPKPEPVPVAGAVPPPAGVSEKYAEETHVNVSPVRHGGGSPLDFAPRTAGSPSGAPMPGQFRRKGLGAKLWGSVLAVVAVVVVILLYLVFSNLK